jgi:hypothetical protein
MMPTIPDINRPICATEGLDVGSDHPPGQGCGRKFAIMEA